MNARPPGTPEDSDAPRERAAEQPEGNDLGVVLTGALPCIGCGYDLQGLSVLAPCPECGIAVRATILYRVDPHAEALRPMPTPWLTAFALPLWSGSGLLAAMLLWVPRLSDVLSELTGGRVDLSAPRAPEVAMGLIGLSGLAAVGMIRPVRGAPAWKSLAAAGAIACYVPLVYAVAMVDGFPARPAPYLEGDVQPARIGWRLVASFSLAASLMLIRPNARELVRRSLTLRTGRVDRQTIFATLGAIGVTAAGDLLRLGSTATDNGLETVLDGVGTLLVLVGSLFVTLGIAGATIDTWRIMRSIVQPSPTPRQVFGRG